MATNLPTLTVQDAQATRILDAYKAKYGTATTADTARAFRKWLAGEVRAVVIAHEASVIDEANNASKRTALATLRAELPDPDAVV
jgi:hypothetical protein